MGKGVRANAAQLKPAQQLVLDALERDDATQLTRSRYQELTGVSRSQAAYDLAELVEAGLLVRIGAGRATRYRLPPADHSRRRWTDGRIRAELSAFCEGRATWPSAAEFKAAGRSDLYVAASRYGGIGFWAAELGFPRSDRGRVQARTRASSWRRSTFAIAAASVFALGAGVTGLALRIHQRDAGPAAPAHVKQHAETVSYLADLRSLRRARVAGYAAEIAAERAAASHVVLLLRASRGDSWISVRSATGRLLDERLLASGTAIRLRGTALWVRLGAAANVDLSTNGSRARPLPTRAAVVVVTPRGMRVAEWAPAESASAPELAARTVPASPAPVSSSTPPAPPAPLPRPAKAVSPPPPPPAAPERRSTGSWPAPLPSP